MSRAYFPAILWVLSLPTLLGGGAALRAEPEPSSATAAIKARGKLVMLCFPTVAGGVSPNLSRGPTRRVGTTEDFVGFEVWLMDKLAGRLGVELEIRSLPEPGFGPLIPAMLEGGADLVASTLSITAERETVVDFSLPYESTYLVVVTREGSDIRTEADLIGKMPVAARGSSHHHHLLALGFAEQDIDFVEFIGEYFTAVASGDADFALSDAAEPDYLEAAKDSHERALKVAFTLQRVDRIAAAMPRGSDLKPHLDALIRELEADGSLEDCRARFRAQAFDSREPDAAPVAVCR